MLRLLIKGLGTMDHERLCRGVRLLAAAALSTALVAGAAIAAPEGYRGGDHGRGFSGAVSARGGGFGTARPSQGWHGAAFQGGGRQTAPVVRNGGWARGPGGGVPAAHADRWNDGRWNNGRWNSGGGWNGRPGGWVGGRPVVAGWDWRHAWGWHGAGWGWNPGAWAWSSLLVGASFGLVVAPPLLFLPPPIYAAPPPVVLGLPAIAPPPLITAAPPIVAAAPLPALRPPPVLVAPPPVVVASLPPPVIVAPPIVAYRAYPRVAVIAPYRWRAPVGVYGGAARWGGPGPWRGGWRGATWQGGGWHGGGWHGGGGGGWHGGGWHR